MITLTNEESYRKTDVIACNSPLNSFFVSCFCILTTKIAIGNHNDPDVNDGVDSDEEDEIGNETVKNGTKIVMIMLTGVIVMLLLT